MRTMMNPFLPVQKDLLSAGHEMLALVRDLFPICRSITGNGVRQTLQRINRDIPLDIHEIPSGTPVFDWTVPREWNIRDAYVKDQDGRRIIDFKQSNLHVLNYSIPVHQYCDLRELKAHLYSLPDHPDWIPYKTSYYRDNWGFCLRHRDLQAMRPGRYEVLIDATLEEGHLTYGELLLPGETEHEILFSAHICHPSLANDNLSGISLAVLLARYLFNTPHRYSYRFLFMPGTIGAITWLARNRENVHKIRHGLVLAGVGNPGILTYKRSRRATAEIDEAVVQAAADLHLAVDLRDFSPYGYDERQFCSPGFNLAVGRVSRTPFGEYAEYHTSADDLAFVKSDLLAESFQMCTRVIEILEGNSRWINLNPFCEPHLGKRNLYQDPGQSEMALLWVLNLSDGTHSLLDICRASRIDFATIKKAADSLCSAGLLGRQGGAIYKNQPG
jgi:aminopeptidase-like protein